MRFYVSPESIFLEKNIIEVKDKREIRHIRDVMRLKRSATVDIFDGKGNEYSGKIKDINRGSVVIEIKNIVDFKSDIPYRVTLYQAMPKKGKIDFIVEKAVELGVDTIVPIITERTRWAIVGEKARLKTERWIRIAKAASKQCGRVELPIIRDVTDFNKGLVESKKSDMTIFAALDKDARPLKEAFEASRPGNIAVFVGPEGDFSQSEISMARKQGCRICSLGPLVLRVETAAIYILSCLNYEYSN
ncbi:RsmE family RNA methyltransferase [Candidatus Omnitrophota bacterium]